MSLENLQFQTIIEDRRWHLASDIENIENVCDLSCRNLDENTRDKIVNPVFVVTLCH